ncbi:MAG TPA: hypothetical protein VMS98_19215 [Thermoanaerobaculia bacterium]|nr:hypothetical protein [Thermoanaerobaculia bacterium]
MNELLWVAASLLLVAFGLPLARSFDLPGRIAVAFAGGTVIAGTLMFAMSVLGLKWSRASLLIPAAGMLLWALLRWARPRWGAAIPGGAADRDRRQEWRRSTWLLLIFALAVYGAAGARMTCGDLLYFWGPKAIHFFEARAIDVEFLRFPHYYLMHPDYPPLQPLALVWSSVMTGRFSWWGAVLLAPLYLMAAVLAFRSLAAPRLGAEKATAYAALLAALLTFGFTAGRAAGGADPMLLMFEVIALSALTFGAGREATIIASVALAGAAFTKVEGSAFVVAIVIALLFVNRRAVAAALPAVILIGSWILFARHHGLLDSYARAEKPLLFDRLGHVLYMGGWQASYRVMYLPWIAALGPLAFGRSFRRAALPLIVAALSLGYTVFFYLHEPEPLWWIRASAERVLLTTLSCLVVASAAASE